ncbi:hypothetical protein DEJ48_03260 [Streptomyces venezuelae]|uniref:Uncharacterized protein n=1 Tax=Streptomyces venezuelae TaxID=54571 RepID=A0A5P2BRF2_STRVZ|nr:hypothetical protein DEJ48_03260 [Streptomyces venezuelae]
MAHDAAQHTAHGAALSADNAPHGPPDALTLSRLPRSALVEALLRNAGRAAGPERPRWESAV